MQAGHRAHLSLKEKQRKEREALILTTAEEVFFEKGYHETSMEEIATRVGIAKGTVYLHFPGKEDLVIAIFDRDMQLLLQGIDAIINSDKYTTPRTKLEAVLYFMHTSLFSRQTQLLSTIYSSVDLKRKITERGGSIHNYWNKIVMYVTTLLERGKAAEEFDESIPTPVMVMTIFGIFSPRSYHHLLLGDNISSDELAKHLIHVCFDGIAVRKAT
jgi:AcrR family transcriptional regulator